MSTGRLNKLAGQIGEYLVCAELMERVLSEPKRNVGFYLDSGWPGDNYEVTLAMALALVSRGWRYGRDLLYLCFPNAAHDEKTWGMRLHLPMQLFTGAVARASSSSERKMAATLPKSA